MSSCNTSKIAIMTTIGLALCLSLSGIGWKAVMEPCSVELIVGLKHQKIPVAGLTMYIMDVQRTAGSSITEKIMKKDFLVTSSDNR